MTEKLEGKNADSNGPLDRLVMHGSLCNRAESQRDEIKKYFSDTEHWNSTRTRFEQIEPDPDGELARLLNSLDKFISAHDIGA